MAKLTRFTMPVFAGNAAQTQTSVFGTMKTSPQYTSDVAASIGTTAYGNGWADAIEIGYAPYLEDMNTLQKAITYQISYGQQQGIPEWASDTEYYKGSLAKLNTANGSQIYSSLVDNNVGNLLSDATKWKLVLDTANTYVTTNTVQTITGAKTFTNGYKSNISVMYNDNITKGTAPSSNSQYINMYMVGDSRTSGDSNALGLFRTYVTTTNTVYSTMQAFKNVASSGASSALRTYYNTAQNKFGIELQALSTGTDTNESMSLSTNATDSARIPTMGWVNNPATSTNVVHRSGNETITGVKTFTSDVSIANDHPMITLRESDVIKGTNPQTEQAWGVLSKDSSNGSESTNLGAFVTHLLTNGTVWSGFSAYKNTSGSTDNASIRVYYPTSGSPWTYAPNPTDTSSTSSQQIATVGWVNNPSIATNLVHKTDNETIAGTKTFTSNVKVSNGDPRVQIINSGVTKGTAPASGEVQGVGFRDKDEKLLGVVQSQYGDSTGTSKATLTKIVAYKASSASDTANANISVGYDSSGNVYTYAPTPSSSSDHSTKIATTDWCQTAFANAIGTPRDVTILWGNGTGSGSPTEFSLSEKFTNFEQIGLVCATDSGDFRNICIESTYWLNWLLSNSGSHTVQLGRSGTSNFAIRSYTASSNPSTNTKFKVSYEDGICYYIFGINRKVKTVTDPLA